MAGGYALDHGQEPTMNHGECNDGWRENREKREQRNRENRTGAEKQTGEDGLVRE